MKQIGDIKLTGTYGGLTCYKLGNEFYGRSKSTLTGKRFRKDKAFEGSRRSSTRFGKGNELASKVYRSLPENEQVYTLYCQLKSKAILLLKEGKEETEVMQNLQALALNPTSSHPTSAHPTSSHPTSSHRVQSVLYFSGSENFPLRLSKKDIWGLEEGLEQDMLNVVKKMEQRLAAKKKRKEKAKASPLITEKALLPIQTKPLGRKIAKPIVLKPRWNKPIYQPPSAIIILTYLSKKHKLLPAPT